MATTAEHGSLVVSSNLTSTMKSLFKEFPHAFQESEKILLDLQQLKPNIGGTRRPVYPVRFPGGESVMRLRFGRLLGNLLPFLAQRTEALTNGTPGSK